MTKNIDVLTFGDLNVDLILSGRDVVPEFGQKEKIVDDYSLEMGGSCSIFACQAARLGLRAAVVGSIGNDSYGEVVFNTLKDAGVNTQYIKRKPDMKTGISISLNTGEDRAMLTYIGTIDGIAGEDIDITLLKQVRHLHIGSYFLMKKIQPHYPKIIKDLKSYGATISLDTNWDPEEEWDSGIWEVLPMIDVFFPNENEAMAVTKEDSLDKAIDKLKKIIPVVAVKKGKEGACVYADENTYFSPSIPGVKVDAVGAGDSFDAGFIYGYLSGKPIEECARIGCICGSLNTRAAGGIKGQPGLKELSGFLE